MQLRSTAHSVTSIILFITYLIPHSDCHAQDNFLIIARPQRPLFLPGDAFFPSRISEKILSSQDDSLTLYYHDKFPHAYRLQDTFGTFRLNVTGNTETLQKHLRTAYEKSTEYIERTFTERTLADGTQKLSESNGPIVLVYSKSFSPTADRFFLKYREEWWTCNADNAAPEEKHATPTSLPYTSQLKTLSHTLEEWRYSKRVEALPAKKERPLFSEDDIPRFIGWSSSIDANECDIYVFPSTNTPDEYANRKRQCTFYKVTSENIHECIFLRHGEVQETLLE